MLKFAERYIEGNAQTPFANAGEHAPPALADLVLRPCRRRLHPVLLDDNAEHGCS
jgi:hypothetical protein